MSELLDYLQQLIFFLDDPIGSKVNLTIVALFALGSVDVIGSAVRLFWERFQIWRATRALTAAPGQCPPTPLTATLKFLKLSRHSLLAKHLARILELRAAGQAAPDLLRRLTAEPLGRYGALARFIAMSLTLIGLLGTVYGLSVAVIKTQLVISQELDLQAMRGLAQALADTLGGMKTAFASTLTGLLTALLLSFGNYVLRRIQAGVAWHLENFVVCRFALAIQTVDPQADAAAEIFATKLQEAAGRLDEVGTKVLSAAGSYEGSASSWRETGERITTAAVSFGDGVTALGEQQRRFTKALTATTKTIQRVGASFEEHFGELQAFTAESRQALENRLDRMAEQSQADRRLEEGLHQLTQDLGKTVQTLDQRFASAVQQQQEWLESALERLDAKAEKHHEKALAMTAETLRAKLGDLVERHGTLLERLLDTQQSNMTDLFGDHHTAFDAVSDLVLDMSQNIDALLRKFEAGFHPLNTSPYGGGNDHAEL